VCFLYTSVIQARLLCLRRVRIRDLVLSPVLAEVLQLPGPGPPHPEAPQGGPYASAAFTASTAAAQEAHWTISAARMASDSAAGADIGHGDEDCADEDCDADGSWFAPCTAARLVDVFHSLAGDRGFLLPDDLVRWAGRRRAQSAVPGLATAALYNARGLW
jgi:hypothetical protein